MNRIRSRITYANVMASVAVFIALGGVGYAATQLPKNSVGSRQLKKNAVKSAKIAPNAVRSGKIAKNAIITNRLRNRAVKTAKLADGAVTGAKIDAASTPFGRIVAELNGTAVVPAKAGAVYPFDPPTYTQPAGRADLYLATMEVTFSAACAAPRSASAFLLVDAPDPSKVLPGEVVALGAVEDKGSGEVTRQVTFGPYPGGSAPWRAAAATATDHSFAINVNGAECAGGSGISLTGAGVQIVGTE